ncbi:uncharacterized protein LOC126905217 isoform X2 [Daktulosphaira vitifoliae]|uniref:uncharacterized protein LOC126905217 isoform X2 n=1 Tax=Daktulosphaira vitifoliae TaxID=58002 RepID=UPI0021AAE5C4|nr:uncharacterized protein LOC126905217 isoform X2 [Daktulosphaira vitifoliae]
MWTRKSKYFRKTNNEIKSHYFKKNQGRSNRVSHYGQNEISTSENSSRERIVLQKKRNQTNLLENIDRYFENHPPQLLHQLVNERGKVRNGYVQRGIHPNFCEQNLDPPSKVHKSRIEDIISCVNLETRNPVKNYRVNISSPEATSTKKRCLDKNISISPIEKLKPLAVNKHYLFNKNIMTKITSRPLTNKKENIITSNFKLTSSPEKLLSDSIRNQVRELKNSLVNRIKEPKKNEILPISKFNDEDFSDVCNLYNKYINEISDDLPKLSSTSKSDNDPGVIVCEELRQCILRLHNSSQKNNKKTDKITKLSTSPTKMFPINNSTPKDFIFNPLFIPVNQQEILSQNDSFELSSAENDDFSSPEPCLGISHSITHYQSTSNVPSFLDFSLDKLNQIDENSNTWNSEDDSFKDLSKI